MSAERLINQSSSIKPCKKIFKSDFFIVRRTVLLSYNNKMSDIYDKKIFLHSSFKQIDSNNERIKKQSYSTTI